MGNSLSCNKPEIAYSYQHLHGVMLINLNRIAFELKLSHTEYHLMGMLIGYWNKQQGKSFPTTRMLAKYSRMGNSTVIKTLKNLSEQGLLIIIKDGKTKRQTYHLNTKKLLNSSNKLVTARVTKIDSTCSNSYKHNRTRTIKKKSSLNSTNKNYCLLKNDDEIKNLSDTKKTILEKLESWNYSNPIKVVTKNSEEKLLSTIKKVETKTPINPGAYFRTMITVKSDSIELNKPTDLINEMIKHKYWYHKSTGKKLQVLPDIGDHILIKYFKSENMVMFLDSGFTDQLTAFELR